MLKHQFLCCLIFSLLALFSQVEADEKLMDLSQKDGQASLFQYSEVLEDPLGELSFEQVLNGDHDFLSVAGGSLSKKGFSQGFTRSAFWLKIDTINASKEAKWYIGAGGAVHRRIEIYLRSGAQKGFSKLQALNGFRGITFSFESALDMQHSFYIRVQDFQSPLELTLQLNTTETMLKQAKYQYPAFAFVFGGLFALAIYNLFYFIYLRDAGFLGLAIFIVAFLVEMGNHMGFGQYFSLTRDYLHYAGTSFGFIALASAVFLFYNLLELKQNAPKSYQFLRIASWICLALVPLVPFIHFGMIIFGAIGFILVLAVTVVMGILYFNNYKFLQSMMLSFLFFVISITPPLLMGAGLIQYTPSLLEFTPLTLLVTLVLLSLTQAEKVRNKGEQAERTLAENQAKDEFLTTMSHELRTPMHAVVGAGHLLNMTPLSGEQQEYVSRLNHSSGHMLSLINDILDLARAESDSVSLEKELFELKGILESLNKLLCGEADNKDLSLTLNNHFTPFQQQLVGDPTRLKQILLNVLSNAIKFTEQGHVSLTITPVQVGSDSVRLHFEVSDTGIGISTEKLKSLFQPFTQAESDIARRYGGSGLGLAISHKLVQLMGGELTVKSVRGQGSSFSFSLTLPLKALAHETKSVETVLKPAPFDKKKLKGFKVLLVDDDEMNRFFGEKLLQACGVTGIVAESGEQALEYLEQQVFDLMLLDVSMPGMNGYQTAKAIRRQKPQSDLTIVALTAHAIKGERERCLDAGMDDFLAKPFELSDLQALLVNYSSNRMSEKQVSNKYR